MARAEQKHGVLRGCPTCGTKVEDTAIGLRDFRWVNEALPGKLGLMDLDGCLTQAATGRALFLELKPKGERISWGARLTFALLVKSGFQVWVLWDMENGRVKLAECNSEGRTPHVREMTKRRAANLVVAWWNAGLED